MQSTANYLWHTDDLLGQGATASVYKARNKVGSNPGQASGQPSLASSCLASWPSQPPEGIEGGGTGISGRRAAHSHCGFEQRDRELKTAP